MTDSVLEIATWNILGRRVEATGEVAPKGAVATLLTSHPVDVLCLQEVHFYDGDPDPQLIEELRDAGLRHFIGLPLSDSHLDSSAQLGVALATRMPISGGDSFCLTNPEIKARVRGELWTLHDKGMIGCTVRVAGGRRLRVYSLHLFPFHEFGVADDHRHVDEMWSEFWRYADDRVDGGELILAGDFNQTARQPAARRWSERSWRFCLDDLVTTTFGLPLDEIALSWSPRSNRPWSVPTFSDHHLAGARIEL